MCSPDGTALLGDFGAATIYCSEVCGHALRCHSDVDGGCVDGCCTDFHEHIQRIEVRAFGIFFAELLAIMKDQSRPEIIESMSFIANSCVSEVLNERPLFSAIDVNLQKLVSSCKKS